MSLKLTPEEVQLILSERKKKNVFPRELADFTNKEKQDAFDRIYTRALVWFYARIERKGVVEAAGELVNAAYDTLNRPDKTYQEMLAPFVEN